MMGWEAACLAMAISAMVAYIVTIWMSRRKP